MITLQASKSHSSKTPKSEHISPATPYAHGSDTHVHTATISPVTPKLQPTSNQPVQSSPQADRLGPLSENLHLRITKIERLIYSTNNQVQLRLTTMENQLDTIQQKLENSLQLFVPKRENAYSKGESNTKGSVHSERGSCVLQRRKAVIYTHTYFWTYCLTLGSLAYQLFTYSFLLSL